jgi:hypothetical protein
MSNTEPTAKTKRARAQRQASTASRLSKTDAEAAPSPRIVSSEQRHAMIAERAYLRAERRGFAGGDPVTDWIESEKEVDALLSS